MSQKQTDNNKNAYFIRLTLECDRVFRTAVIVCGPLIGREAL